MWLKKSLGEEKEVLLVEKSCGKDFFSIFARNIIHYKNDANDLYIE